MHKDNNKIVAFEYLDSSSNESGAVLAVAVGQYDGTVKVYLGFVEYKTNWEEEDMWDYVAKNGTKQRPEVGEAIFPRFNGNVVYENR